MMRSAYAVSCRGLGMLRGDLGQAEFVNDRFSDRVLLQYCPARLL